MVPHSRQEAVIGRILGAAAGLIGWALLAGAAQACDLPQPTGKVILTVDGAIGACNAGGEVRFDRAMIESLPKRDVKTSNPWEQGRVAYQGVLLRDLLAYVKAEGRTLALTALNDFHTEISVADTQAIDVILAYRREGVDLTVRDRGPFFVVFPFSTVKNLANEVRYAQSIWQVDRISVR